MADWRGLTESMKQGYLLGRDIGGGRISQLGSLIGQVANELRKNREAKEAFNILGKTEALRAKVKNMFPSAEDLARSDYYRSEAEKNRRTIDFGQPIVDESGNVVGNRPTGSVFKPKGVNKELTFSAALEILSNPEKSIQVKKKYPSLYKKAEAMVLKSFNSGGGGSSAVSEDEGLMDTDW